MQHNLNYELGLKARIARTEKLFISLHIKLGVFFSKSSVNALLLLCKKFSKVETQSYLGLKARIARTGKLVMMYF